MTGDSTAAAPSWSPAGAAAVAADLRVRLGVRVRLDEPLDLTNASLPVELRLEDSLIAAPLILAGAHGPSRMSLDGSHFTAAIDFGRLELAGGLTMRRAVVFDLALGGARIGDDVDLTDLAAGGTRRRMPPPPAAPYDSARDPRAFNNKSVGARFAVISAGVKSAFSVTMNPFRRLI